jgi:hypothetical protein
VSKKKPKPKVISFLCSNEEVARIDAARAHVVAASGIPASRAAYAKAAVLAHPRHRQISNVVAASEEAGGLTAAQVRNLLDSSERL